MIILTYIFILIIPLKKCSVNLIEISIFNILTHISMTVDIYSPIHTFRGWDLNILSDTYNQGVSNEFMVMRLLRDILKPIQIKYPCRNLKHEICILQHMPQIKSHFLQLNLVLRNSLHRKTLNIDRIPIQKRARAGKMLVSRMFLRHDELNSMFLLFSTLI